MKIATNITWGRLYTYKKEKKQFTKEWNALKHQSVRRIPKQHGDLLCETRRVVINNSKGCYGIK